MSQGHKLPWVHELEGTGHLLPQRSSGLSQFSRRFQGARCHHVPRFSEWELDVHAIDVDPKMSVLRTRDLRRYTWRANAKVQVGGAGGVEIYNLPNTEHAARPTGAGRAGRG